MAVENEGMSSSHVRSSPDKSTKSKKNILIQTYDLPAAAGCISCPHPSLPHCWSVATLLVGVRFGILTTVFNAFILLILGFFVANGTVVWIKDSPKVMKSYVLTSGPLLQENLFH